MLILRSLHWIGQASVIYLATVILTSRIFFYTSQVSTVPMTWLVACPSLSICFMRSDILCKPGPHWLVCLGRLLQSQGLFSQATGLESGSSAYLYKVIEHWVVLLFINGLGIFYPGRCGYTGYNSPFSRPNEAMLSQLLLIFPSENNMK